MREVGARFHSDLALAGTFCLPEDAGPRRPAPAFVLLGGTGGDTRDGDIWPPYREAGRSGLLRRIAHHLAHHGVATLRFDKRGCGESAGDQATSDYHTDLIDNKAAFAWLRHRPEVDAARVGAIGHSAGAFNACLLCRDVPEVAAAGLLGALYGTIDELVRWNCQRLAAHWDRFSPEQRAWLVAERPREVARAFRYEEFIAAATRGQERVTLGAHGVEVEMSTIRFRQDLERPVAAEFRHVRCPALVLHGGADMNVKVDDALDAYQALRAIGNEAVDLVIVPGVDHSFQPVDRDPTRRVWDRVSLATLERPVSQLALDALALWARRAIE